MPCRDAEGCAAKAVRHREAQDARVLEAERVVRRFAEMRRSSRAWWRPTGHAVRRMVERAVGRRQVEDALRFGWPIEWTRGGDGWVRILVLVWDTRGPAVRPLHVLMQYDPRNFAEWTVVTVYDPRTRAWKWDAAFERRVCFCPDEDDPDLT